MGVTNMSYNNRRIEPIKSGWQKLTIRLMMHPGDKPRKGEKLNHFAYVRPKVHKCFHSSKCSYTQEVRMDDSGMKLDGVALSPIRISEIARQEGYRDNLEFRDHYLKKYGFPFHGVLVAWE